MNIKRLECPKCNKCFNRKAHLEQYYNKKNPCVNNLDIIKSIKIQIPIHNNIDEQNPINKLDKSIQCDIIDEDIDLDTNITCEYCVKSFYQVSNLNIKIYIKKIDIF